MAFNLLGKRNGATDASPKKAQRGPGPDDPDQWQCVKCGNLNYGSRVVCNMRSCGAPKEDANWVCSGCGNENYPNRLYCNMRRCQQIRPGVTMQQLQQAGPGAPGNGSPPMTSVPAHKGFKGGGKGGSPGNGQHADGSWTCVCGNLNYPNRMVCNSRSCGKPRPAPSWGGAFGYDAPAFQQPYYAVGMQLASMVSAGRQQKPKDPPGSWSCTACKNVNWPDRQTCNAKNCGQPRDLVDGGAPPKPGEPPAPEGSWTCSACQNVNWPSRLVCNKKGCGLPRP